MRLKYFILPLILFLTTFSQAGYRMGSKKPQKTRSHPQKEHDRAESRITTNENDTLRRLSIQFDIDQEELEYYRGLNHGYNQLIAALVVSREANVGLDEVLEYRVEGKSWTEIEELLRIDLRYLNKKVVSILKPIKATFPEEFLTEIPEKQANVKKEN